MQLMWMLNYQVHLSEYGTHWNFFLSLSLIQLMSVLSGNLNIMSRVVVGGGLVVGHQWALEQLGVKQYMLDNSRQGVLQANKEGVFGILAYYSIFLFGQAFRQLLDLHLFNNNNNRINRLRMIQMGLGLLLCYSLLFSSINSFGPISRRLYNLQFVLWIVTFNITMIYLFYLI